MVRTTHARGPRWVVIAALSMLLAGCTQAPTASALQSLPLDAAPAHALSDFGTASDIAAVKQTVQLALTTELRVFDVDEHGAPLVSPAKRTSMVNAVDAGIQRTMLQESLAKIGQPPYRQGGHFVVERWEGVEILNDRARVFVTGHSAYTPTAVSPQKEDDLLQHQLLLTREDGTWRVTLERSATVNQG